MRPDTHTRTEADAAAYAALQGRDEYIGGGPGDQEADPLLDGHDARLRPDPWDDVHICPSCGEKTDHQPQRCGVCNWRNYGRAS